MYTQSSESTFNLDKNWQIWLGGGVDEFYEPEYVYDNDEGYICYSPLEEPLTWLFLQYNWQD